MPISAPSHFDCTFNEKSNKLGWAALNIYGPLLIVDIYMEYGLLLIVDKYGPL